MSAVVECYNCWRILLEMYPVSPMAVVMWHIIVMTCREGFPVSKTVTKPRYCSILMTVREIRSGRWTVMER